MGVATAIATEDPQLLWAQSIGKERGMRRDQDLGTVGSEATLFGQLGEQARVKVVLRLLDPDQLRR